MLLFSVVLPVFAQTSEEATTSQTTEETDVTGTEEAVPTLYTTESEAFSDVSSGYEDKTPIDYLHDQGVLKGYPDGTFKPRGIVNRAELMKIMVVGQGIEPPAATYKNCFPDVKEEWFAPYVCYAKEQGWVAGYPDGNFRPGNPVNRAEAAKMILNALGIKLDETSALYSDVKAGEWFARYARTIRLKRLAKWDTFNGPLGMTRVEVAIMLYRILVITQQDVAAFSDNLAANFDATMPVDIIALKNRVVEETKERLAQSKTLYEAAIADAVAGKYEDALSKYNSTLILTPRFATAWAGKAYTHFKLEQYEKARFSINTALVLNPLKPVFYAIKSVILYKLDMPKRALNHLIITANMREKLELSLDPLPAKDTWSGMTAEALAAAAETAIEAWSWDPQLTLAQWAEKYTIDEAAERAGTDTSAD